ncbi:MAG: aldolase, partial [Chloroflexota bacterium]
GTAEIHLATGFQNILYDDGGLPDTLRAEMMAWCLANCEGERTPGETDEQFLYKTRKKAIGPFKEALWTLPAESQEQIGANMHVKFGLLFDKLGIAGTRSLVDRFVRIPDQPRPLPAALGGGGEKVVVAEASVFEDDGSGE